ncbi:MAG: 4-(cytidine 5'-diphospho)-2-C-methyl-D-erythritol kinase [Christensenellales bacterium]|jgi:4-diphosphocytidyl-2-C-methyl-D-erythritol kinase
MITLKAYAKLNLSLAIIGKRADGYHELDTIMQSISLFDTVTVNKAPGTRVRMNIDSVNEKYNTAYAAAETFAQYTGLHGADIFIEKRIPRMAGLGGSSADAAAVLAGLDKLYDTNLSIETLLELAKGIGADVPFALFGGTARAKGIGERLKRLSLQKQMYYVVIKPYQGVSTAEAFGRYRQSSYISMDTVEYAVQKGDIDLYCRYAANALGLAALSIAPDILKAAQALMSAGAKNALMSGSGSSMFAVFDTEEEARLAAQCIKGDFELCGAYCPKDNGIEIMGETNGSV